jgi:hypothetical protein
MASEICISGMATLRTQSPRPTTHRQPKGRVEERMGQNKIINVKIDITNNENENPRGNRLGTVSGETICHRVLKPGKRMHQSPQQVVI